MVQPRGGTNIEEELRLRQEARKTRMQYRALNNEVQAQSEEIGDNENTQVLHDKVQKLNGLFSSVTRTREGVYDASVFKNITKIAKRGADKLGSVRQFQLKDMLKRIRNSYAEGQDGDDEEEGAEEANINWGNLGKTASWVFCNQACSLEIMLGPLKYSPPKRKVAQRRVRDTPIGPTINADEVEDIEDAKAYTSQLTKVIFDVMVKHKKPVSLWELLVDPDSYSHTIENIFSYAFLARDGKVDITLSGDVPMTKVRLDAQEQAAAGTMKTNQFVMGMDFSRYQKIIKQHNITECLLPKRDENVLDCVYKLKATEKDVEEEDAPVAAASKAPQKQKAPEKKRAAVAVRSDSDEEEVADVVKIKKKPRRAA